jgi:predicted acyl esterase
LVCSWEWDGSPSSSATFSLGDPLSELRHRCSGSSSSLPRFRRNLNTGRGIAEGAEIRVVRQRVFHDARYSSHILLPVIAR